MKTLYFIIFFSLFFLNNSYSAELIDCAQFKKLNIKFLNCKAKNLKSILNENQSKTKEKISESTKNMKLKINKSEPKKKLDKILKKNGD